MSNWGTIPHMVESKSDADESWWLRDIPREQFTARATEELPRMRKGRGAALADQERHGWYTEGRR